MNVFEDLVVELQQENLLEMPDPASATNGHAFAEMHDAHAETASEAVAVMEAPATESEPQVTEAHPKVMEAEPHVEAQPEPETAELDADSWAEDEAKPEEAAEPAVKPQPNKNSEFFKKRAVDEVASLQMVEHVLTGVEREYQKIVPRSFDDFQTKRALHAFVQAADDVESDECKQAEVALHDEIAAWCSALAERDRAIPVSSVRQYIENSRPQLSSQAMLAVARFYRNLPYSEAVRGKFDFVITRLFSRPAKREMRQLLFKREEMQGHLETLYADWSSTALYEVGEDDSNIMLTALSFEELCEEAETAAGFDQLLANDFFGRLRLFKESIAELFFAPRVAVAAMDCNVRVGNAYVNLIDRERERMDSESIQSKYAELSGPEASDAASRTLDLADLLRARAENPDPVIEEEEIIDEPASEYDKLLAQPEPAPAKAKPAKAERAGFVGRMIANARAINKWFLAVAVLLIGASVGLYVWANFYAGDTVSSSGVKNINIENTIYKEHIKQARVTGDTFYGLLLPSWDVLPKDKRMEYLQKVFAACREQGCTQVELITKDGKPAAFASATRVEVIMP